MNDPTRGSGSGAKVDDAGHRDMDYQGTTVVNYRLVAKLGEGGFGVVYLAEHVDLGRKAAVKILHPEYARRQALVERFFREARAVCAIDHSAIVDVQNFGRLETGEPYYLMEYLAGEDLARLVERVGPLPANTIRDVFGPVASALSAAHHNGVIHRDLKPDNVMVRIDGEAVAEVKLLDFGIAKLLDPTLTAQSQTGITMGTPAFMAPEQARDAKSVDVRADVYSLGATIYYCLTGRPPFVAENITDLILLVHTTEPPRPSTLVPGLSPALDDALMACLCREPEGRPPSIEHAWGRLHSGLAVMPPVADSADQPLTPTEPPSARRARTALGPIRPQQTTLGASATSVGPKVRPQRGRAGRYFLVLGALLAVAGAATFSVISLRGGDDAGAAGDSDGGAQSADNTESPPPFDAAAVAAAEPAQDGRGIPVAELGNDAGLAPSPEPRTERAQGTDSDARAVAAADDKRTRRERETEAKRLLEKARKQIAAGKFRTALDTLGESMKLKSSAESYRLRAFAHNKLGDKKSACSDLRKALDRGLSGKRAADAKKHLERSCAPPASAEATPDNIDKPSAEPDLPDVASVSDIGAALRSANRRLRPCVKKSATRGQGKLYLRIKILASGEVASAVPTDGTPSSLYRGDATSCVRRVVRSIRFPAAKNGRTLTYKFNL